MSSPLLEVRDLSVGFVLQSGMMPAVNGVSFSIQKGEIVGLVGESGSGKSVTALSLLGLLPSPGQISRGEVLLEGRNLVGLSERQLRAIRGREVAMIFQDPQSSLNPVLRSGFQIAEAMLAHHRQPRRGALARSVELLRQVRVPAAEQRARDYPHQLSGGMRQRVMIAMGLANAPRLLIADEPTTALDVTVQAQILELLRVLNSEHGTAILLISHNLAVVAGICDRVLVMYGGRIVEAGPVEQIFTQPMHPYTWSLLRALPRIDDLRHSRLRSIEGQPPDLMNPVPGCSFHPRCPFRIERCFREDPPLEEVAEGQKVACWVTMRRAREEMDADNLRDVRPGAGSGIHPPCGEGEEPETVGHREVDHSGSWGGGSNQSPHHGPGERK